MTTRAAGEEEGGFGGMMLTQAMGEQEGDMMAPLLDFARPSDITLGGYGYGGDGKAPGIEDSMAVTTRALGEDASGGMLPGFGGSLEQAPGLLGSMLTQAMGEQEGDMMPPSLITDIGRPSGGNNFSTAAVGEDGGGFEPPMATTMAVGEEDGSGSGPGFPGGLLPGTLPPSFGPTTLAMGEEDGGGGNLLPEPFEPPSQSRTTELIEELISLLRGSRSPPSVFERPMPRPRPQPIFSPPPPRTPPPAPVSGTGVLGSLASNPLFQDFATQLQSSNPQQSDILSEMFKSADQKSQGQNQFAPQSNPFMSSSSPFMAPPQFFSPKAYGQFAPPPMGFSQFQPPIPYGSAGGFAPPPPQFAPMQQGRGDSSPFASSIRNVGFA